MTSNKLPKKDEEKGIQIRARLHCFIEGYNLWDGPLGTIKTQILLFQQE